jgi:hypothetical protein
MEGCSSGHATRRKAEEIPNSLLFACMQEIFSSGGAMRCMSACVDVHADMHLITLPVGNITCIYTCLQEHGGMPYGMLHVRAHFYFEPVHWPSDFF